MLTRIIAYFGSFGIYFTCGCIVYSFKQKKCWYLFGICFLIVLLVNQLLKHLIQEPRPQNVTYLSKIEQLFDAGKYGMPSGHAQIIGYLFYIFVNKKKLSVHLKIIIITQAIASLWQRYAYNKHTSTQIVIGFIVGYIIGYLLHNNVLNLND